MEKICVGVDLGSTYSSFSTYDEVENTVRTVSALEGSGAESIPSIACLDMSGQLHVGEDAKAYIALQAIYPSIQVFRAFKMLLPENRKDLLEKRGYSAQFTPQKITEQYLDYHLRGIAGRSSSPRKEIDHLVICAPEVWGKRDETQDGKPIVREICQRLEYVKRVSVVSEPAAASAFFTYYFRKQTGKPFQGNILIIDYGGGTLDITLTEIESSIDEDGNTSTEIRVRDCTGAGENQPEGKVGDAGIAYMEKLAELALRRSGLLKEGELPERQKFGLMFNFLEQALKNPNNVSKIARKLRRYQDDFSEFAASEEELFQVHYGQTLVSITYALLNRAYELVIEPVLEQQLDLIIQSMKAFGIDYENPTSEHFKIALVGGFGNFALVERQIKNKFHFSANDRRLKDIGADMRECAISHGAALVAHGAVKIRTTADRSIGLFSHKEGSEEEVCDFAIHYRQELRPGTIYYIPYSATNPAPKVYMNVEGKIRSFGVARGNQKPRKLTLNEETQRRLTHLPGDMNCLHYGFSIDEAEVYYFHVEVLNEETGVFERYGEPIKLDRFSKLFNEMIQLDWEY